MSRPFGVTRLAFLLLLPSIAQAQNNSWSVSVPSPTAAALGKFGDIPVSLYTGVPEISVPLFIVRGKTLQLPLALSYHASGVKVEEIGGWVGMGWTLEAGGVITRSVRGLPDESQYGYYNTGNSFYDPQYWPLPTYNLARSMVQNFIDGEPDQFFVNLGGRSAQFVMGPTGTLLASREIRPIPYQKWRIVPTLSNGISQWVVTTEDGTQYTFGAREDQYSLTQGPLSTPYTASWYLTKIKSTAGDSISLQYQSYSVRHDQGTSGEQRDEATLCTDSWTQYVNSNQITALRLSSILSAAQSVTFTTSFRTDALNSIGGSQQEPKLDLITVSVPGGPVLRKFALGYDSSIASPGRLTLISVAEQDAAVNSLPPYTFTYSGPQLPARTSYAVDHWGYYNAKTNNGSYVPPGRSASGIFYSGADRRPDSAAMLAGTLTRITYPTGGYSDFTYEPNDYSWIYTGVGSMTDSSAVIQSPQATATGGSSTQTRSFNVAGLDTVWATISVNISAVPSCTSNCPGVELLDAAGNLMTWARWTSNTSQTLYLGPGTYQIRATSAGYPPTVTGIVGWRELQSVPRKRGGGIRIAEVRASDAMGGITIRKYKYRLASDSSQSSGMIEAEPKYDYNFFAQSYETNGNPGPTCAYYSRSFMSRLSLGGGSPVVYREVAVWYGANGEYGKERHVFYLGDRPPETSGGWPFHRHTSLYWRWGQEILAQIFDSAGRIQRAVASTYQFPLDTISYRDFHGVSLISFPNPTTPVSPGPFIDAAPFRIESAWKYKSAETVTIYDTTGTASISSTKTFTYGNPRHAQVTQVTETNSDGRQRITRYRYPADYAITSVSDSETAALQAMQGSAYMHSVVVERLVSEKVGSTESLVQGELTTFRQFLANQYLPYQHFILNSPAPIP